MSAKFLQSAICSSCITCYRVEFVLFRDDWNFSDTVGHLSEKLHADWVAFCDVTNEGLCIFMF